MRIKHLLVVMALFTLASFAPSAWAQNETDGGDAEIDIDLPEESRSDGDVDGLSATTMVVLVVLAVLVIGLIVAVASRR